MKTTVMNPDTLAHHLDVAAAQYDRDAAHARDVMGAEAGASLARTFDDQAKQAREWAGALRNLQAVRVGPFEGDDIEVGHD